MFRCFAILVLSLVAGTMFVFPVKARIVTTAELEGYGCPPVISKYERRVQSYESSGGIYCQEPWTCRGGTAPGYTMIGAFQFSAGYYNTFYDYFGYNFFPSKKFPSPQDQISAHIRFGKNMWKAAVRLGSTKCVGKEICNLGKKVGNVATGACAKATNSSITMASQLGEGNVKKFADNGCGGNTADAKGTTVAAYMIAGACHDVSLLTESPPDVKEGDDCKVYPDRPYDPEKNPLLPGVTSSDVNPVSPKAEAQPNCVNLRLQRAITMAQMDFKNTLTAAKQKVYRDMKMKDYWGCIIKITDYLSVITSILKKSETFIGLIVLGILSVVMSQVCQTIITAINNLLTMACLPVPNLGLNLAMPSLQRQTCDGISLANFMPVTGGPIGLGGMLPGGMTPMSIIPPRQTRTYETFIGVKP